MSVLRTPGDLDMALRELQHAPDACQCDRCIIARNTLVPADVAFIDESLQGLQSGGAGAFVTILPNGNLRYILMHSDELQAIGILTSLIDALASRIKRIST